MVKAVFFDVDGTILHTLGAIKMAGDRAIERYGHPTIPYDKYREFIGDGPVMLIKRAMNYCGDTNEKHFEGALNAFKEFLRRNYNAGVEQFVGMYDTIRDIKETGIFVAVLTNKDQRAAEGNIQRFFGNDLFEKIVGFQEGFICKPAPDEALKLAEELGVKPEECVMVGDGQTDVMVAKNAGMKSIAVLWGYRTKEELAPLEPDYFAEKHEELPEIICRINEENERQEGGR